MAVAALRFVPCLEVQRCEMQHSRSDTGGPSSGCRRKRRCPAEALSAPRARAAWVHGTALLLLLLLQGSTAVGKSTGHRSSHRRNGARALAWAVSGLCRLALQSPLHDQADPREQRDHRQHTVQQGRLAH